MIPLLAITIDDRTTPSVLERIRRNIVEVLAEVRKLPFVTAKVAKADVTLPDGIPVAIAHGLGRKAYVWTSPPRNAVSSGRIEEVRDGSHDPAKFVVLKATGWGASITVDVFVL